jgi:hypothetical protein
LFEDVEHSATSLKDGRDGGRSSPRPKSADRRVS